MENAGPANKSCMLEIVGYFSPIRAELEGGSVALRELAGILTSSLDELRCSLVTPSGISPAPYAGFLDAVQILGNGNKIVIHRQEQVLVIEGSIDNLALLAQNIAFLADNFDPSEAERDHAHIEYYSDHYYLDESSLSLIVTVLSLPPWHRP